MLAKISLAISILLAIAVGYLLFKGDKTPETSTAEVSTGAAISDSGATKATVVAFLNGDSLNARYKYIKDKSGGFEAAVRNADKLIQDEYAVYQSERMKWEAYLNTPSATAEDRKKFEQDMRTREAALQKLDADQKEIINKKQLDFQKDLKGRIDAVLTTYCKEKGIDYVVHSLEELQILLYSNPDYDITTDVINILNEAYEAEKK